ncbi:MAG: hypothetical protein OXI97_08960 [Acidimicrobiaceae bacterium]|nr:hypothetical protein [Acidimicrobiaceae bacterium]
MPADLDLAPVARAALTADVVALSNAGLGRCTATVYSVGVTAGVRPATLSVTWADAAGSNSANRSPQHTTLLSVLTPHECRPPADTELNDPDGASDCPEPFQPQHSTVASVLTPQVCHVPADTELNDPAGGDARPSSS